MKIMYWSDYACPYCYIGVTNLKNAMADLGIETEVKMMAFQLHPEADKQRRIKQMDDMAERYGIPREQAKLTLARILAMAEEAGLKMNYDQVEYANTEDAHRLTKYAQMTDMKKADALINRLYQAYFVDGIWLGDHEKLADLASECGFDRAEALNSFREEKYLEEVKNQEEFAAAMQVQGVPYFVFNEQYVVPGALNKEQMKQVLVKVIELEAQDLGIAAGAACGPDGCDA
ncbi:MAG: DsbA family oxidoreductase [Solobacterium sp.]|nr:DsbA family oxidoreductase [Solobacterium sp.]